MLGGLFVASLIGWLSLAHAYCPEFMKAEKSCSCYSYIDGAIIKCSGPDGPGVVEKLKAVQTEIRELILEDANIIEVWRFR